MQKIGRVIAIGILLVTASGLVGWFTGRSSGRREMILEAVKQNHGHYRIVDDQGNTQFEWGVGTTPKP